MVVRVQRALGVGIPGEAWGSLQPVDARWAVDGWRRSVRLGPGLHVVQQQVEGSWRTTLWTPPDFPPGILLDEAPAPVRRRDRVVRREDGVVRRPMRPMEKTPLLVGGGLVLAGSAVAVGVGGGQQDRALTLGGVGGLALGLGLATWGVLLEAPPVRF